jgi:hypothetical protein
MMTARKQRPMTVFMLTLMDQARYACHHHPWTSPPHTRPPPPMQDRPVLAVVLEGVEAVLVSSPVAPQLVDSHATLSTCPGVHYNLTQVGGPNDCEASSSHRRHSVAVVL